MKKYQAYLRKKETLISKLYVFSSLPSLLIICPKSKFQSSLSIPSLQQQTHFTMLIACLPWKFSLIYAGKAIRQFTTFSMPLMTLRTITVGSIHSNLFLKYISLFNHLKILEVQKNIFVLAHACTFLNTLIEAHTVEPVRNSLKEELLCYGIEVIYAVNHLFDFFTIGY